MQYIGYWILIAVAIIGGGMLWLAIVSSERHRKAEDDIAVFGVIGTIASCAAIVALLGFGVGGIVSWCNHASDLGTIRAGRYSITVQLERCDRLKQELEKDLPMGVNGQTILLDKDSPYKALIDQLAAAETDLATAKRQVSDARVSVAQRAAGPYGFIVSLMGAE